MFEILDVPEIDYDNAFSRPDEFEISRIDAMTGASHIHKVCESDAPHCNYSMDLVAELMEDDCDQPEMNSNMDTWMSSVIESSSKWII